MPDALVVVAGTTTEVGKTWLAAALTRDLLENGHRVVVRKPVMSFDPREGRTDAQVLAAASGEDEHAVCPAHRRYELAMAPPMAADALGRPSIRIADLVAEIALPPEGIALVEGVGGVRSPLAHDGDTRSLCARLQPDLTVVVAPSGLGAINDVLTNVESLGSTGPLLVFLNRFDPEDDLQRRNLEWLRGRAGLTVAVTVDEVTRRVEALPNSLGTPIRQVEVR